LRFHGPNPAAALAGSGPELAPVPTRAAPGGTVQVGAGAVPSLYAPHRRKLEP